MSASNGSGNAMATLNASIARLTDEMTLFRQDMAVHNAKQAPFEEMVRNHDLTLYGDKQSNAGGLVSELVLLERESRKRWENSDRVLWVVLTPFLTGIGLGVIYLIQLVSK